MAKLNSSDIANLEDYRYFKEAVRRGWIKPVSQKRALEMCERILVAALKVFGDQGFRDTKILDVANVAGCSVGIFYKRFTDKEGLFYTLQYRHYELGNRMLDRLSTVHESRLTTAEVLYRFVQRTLNNMVLQSGFHKALMEVSLKDRRANRARKAHIRYAGDRLMGFLVKRNELPDTKEAREKVRFAVSVVFSTITGLVVLGPGPYSAKDRRVVENLAEFLEGFLHEEQQRLKARTR